jgi:ABC-type transporter Mla subunit MlaD
MKLLSHSLKAVFILSVITVLTACGSSDTKISALFNNTTDIKDGEPVYIAEKQIGEVVDVQSVEGATKVTVRIEEDHFAAVRGSAALVKNRLKASAPLEIYNREGDTTDLVDGQTITGLDSMFQLGAWMVGDAIKLGGASIGQYVDAFTKYLNSEQFENDKANVKSQIEQATQDMSVAVGTVGEQVNQAVKDLAAAEGPASEAVKQLGDELSPMVEELAGSGTAIIKQIEALTQSLADTNTQEQQAGENFLATLVETLEKLNQSFEKGALENQATPAPAEGEQGSLEKLEPPIEQVPEQDSDDSSTEVELQREST